MFNNKRRFFDVPIGDLLHMKELFKNCIDLLDVDGWILPTRFTEYQRGAIATSENQYIRSYAPTHVCLAFKTSATKISLEYKITGKARAWALFDLVRDGLLADSITLEADEGRVEFSLSGDANSEYRLYLPHLVVVLIRNITSDAQLFPVADRGSLWLALGDSITQGMDARHPTNSYPAIISDYMNIDVLNTGVGGAKFNAAQLDHIGKEPSLITIAFGCNDWGITRENMIANVTAYMEKLISFYECRNIYAILPIWRGNENEIRADMTYRDHIEVIRSVFEKYPFVKIIDGYEIIPHLPEFYGETTRPSCHPTAEGFAIMSRELMKRIFC